MEWNCEECIHKPVCDEWGYQDGMAACSFGNYYQEDVAKVVETIEKPAVAEKDDVLDFNTNRPRPDFVFRAEKELQKAANDLESAVRRGAPQADIFNLQRKVEYKWYVLELLKGV